MVSILEPIPNIFKFLSYSDEILNECCKDTVFDLFICCDCGDLSRLGFAAECFCKAKTTACIDHHVSNSRLQMKIIFSEAVLHVSWYLI